MPAEVCSGIFVEKVRFQGGSRQTSRLSEGFPECAVFPRCGYEFWKINFSICEIANENSHFVLAPPDASPRNLLPAFGAGTNFAK